MQWPHLIISPALISACFSTRNFTSFSWLKWQLHFFGRSLWPRKNAIGVYRFGERNDFGPPENQNKISANCYNDIKIDYKLRIEKKYLQKFFSSEELIPLESLRDMRIILGEERYWSLLEKMRQKTKLGWEKDTVFTEQPYLGLEYGFPYSPELKKTQKQH